jgi:hypothetical protein
MSRRDLEPQTMNFMATAEAVYRERSLLSRIDRLLANPFKLSLGEDRFRLLQITFLHHMDLLAQAEAEWKLGPELLEECLDHLEQAGVRHRYSEDLELVRQAEETLAIIGEVDELLRPFAALTDEEARQASPLRGTVPSSRTPDRL